MRISARRKRRIVQAVTNAIPGDDPGGIKAAGVLPGECLVRIINAGKTICRAYGRVTLERSSAPDIPCLGFLSAPYTAPEQNLYRHRSSIEPNGFPS
jgi:hypothetical protein